jgi:aerotaxis receptor
MAAVIPAQTGREVFLGPEELIISKTDPSGHITYANRVFMRIVAMNEDGLLGKPHNIIRHPDMPRGAFRLLWKTLQSDREFFGVVKNFTAKGDFYWVFANITPDLDMSGKLQGYFSVRRQAERRAIEALEPVYAEMRRIEAGCSRAEAPDVSMNWLIETLASQGTDYESFILGLYGSAPAGGAAR